MEHPARAHFSMATTQSGQPLKKRTIGSLLIQQSHSKDFGQTGHMPNTVDALKLSLISFKFRSSVNKIRQINKNRTCEYKCVF